MGAQGVVDFRNDEATIQQVRDMKPDALLRRQERAWILYGVPWVETKEQFFARMSKEELVRQQVAEHSGVISRQGTSASHPPHIPSLIGVKDRKYLDSTGFARHRSIGDLARYAVTNQGLDTLAHYGDFQPSLNETPFSSEKGTRYSDEQLYALALYIYSLEAPENPNSVNDRKRLVNHLRSGAGGMAVAAGSRLKLGPGRSWVSSCGEAVRRAG